MSAWIGWSLDWQALPDIHHVDHPFLIRNIHNTLEEEVSAIATCCVPPEVAFGNISASAGVERLIARRKRASKAALELEEANARLEDRVAARVAILEPDRRRTEEELRESERTLEMLLSNLPGLAYRCRNDRDRTMEFISQGCLDLTGYQRADLIDNSRIAFAQMIHPDDREKVWNSVQSAVKTRETYRLTYRIVTRSEEEKWIWEQGCAVFSPTGVAVALEGFITDITGGKRAEKALQESEERLRLVAETSPDTIFHQDADLRYTWIVSPVMGASEIEESLGKTDLERFEWFSRNEASRLMEIKRKLLETGIGARAQVVLPVGGTARYFDSVYEPERSADGKVVGIFGYARDVTERKQAEDALKQGEEMYRTLVETIDDSVHIKDLGGRYFMVNSAAARRFGLAKAEIIGRTAPELYEPEEASQVMASDRQVMETGTPLDAEEVHHYPGDRAARHVHVRKVPLRDRNGKVAGVVTVSRDITERKQAEEAQRDGEDRLRRAMEGIVEAMSTVTEMRDPYTAGHQRRVSKLAFAIAKAIGLQEGQREAVRLAGSIHDIGNISIPAEILNKSGRLSEVERQMVRTHSRSGYDILKGIAFPWPIAEPILQHHERLDGSGYPDGLVGNSILLEARILAVADVVEAMCSHRPYRPALGINNALEEISQQKGILYEAEVVDACLRLFARGDFAFE